MKKTILSLAAFLLAFTFTQAQSAQFVSHETGKLVNGTVTYKVSTESSEPSLAMMNGSMVTLNFAGNKSKVNAMLMGGMVSGDIIIDGNSNKGLALLNMMAQKHAIHISDSDLLTAKNATQRISSLKVQKLEGSKKIAGYKCQKIQLTSSTNPNDKMIVYVTSAIQPKFAGIFDNLYKELNGFPLELELGNESTGEKMTVTATEISKKRLSNSEFEMSIPQGYEEATLEDFMKAMGSN